MPLAPTGRVGSPDGPSRALLALCLGNKLTMSDMANIAIVTVSGDLDVSAVPSVRRRIDQLVSQGCLRIFLNMDGASYVDSAGMGLILTELRRMRGMGGLISLVNVSPQAYQALQRMRMLDYMPVVRSGTRRRVSALDPSVLPSWRTTFRVEPVALSEARERVGELLSSLPLSADEVFDMTLAVGEALGNAVDHTCGGGVLATIAAYPDRATIEVTDCGGGFELAEDEELPVAGPCAERGRGIRLMRLLADSVSVTRKTAGEGTVVRLVKLFDAPDAGAPEVGVPA